MKKIKIDRRFWGKLKNFLYNLFLVVVLLLAGLVAASTLNIPGNSKIFVVQSGSMEPKIKRMGIVVVKPVGEYKKGDVITVAEPANPKVTLTHRVVDIQTEKGKTLFVTKGDANEDADTEKRPLENVLGKVLFTIPYLGYPVTFAKTQTGFIVLIIIPAVLIVYSELMTIKSEALRLIAERKRRKLTMKEKIEGKIGEEIITVEKEVKGAEKGMMGVLKIINRVRKV
jgi:signal peptidase